MTLACYFDLLEDSAKLPCRTVADTLGKFQHEISEKYKSRLSFKDIELRTIEGMNNGFVAVRDISAGSVVLQVPYEAMLTEDTVLKDAALGNWARKYPMICASPDLLISLFLAHEACNPSSEWKSYINGLPTSFDIPFYLSRNDFNLLLKETSVYDKVNSAMNVLTSQFLFIRRAIQAEPLPYLNLENLTFSLFMWASSVVMTRRNIIETSDGRKQLALIPLWDMCNHSFTQSPSVNTAFDCENMVLECWAGSDIREGEQFYINYGNRSNADLYAFSGFVVDQHPDDYIQLSILIKGEGKQKIMEKFTGMPICREGNYRLPLYKNLESPGNQPLLFAIQVLVANDKDFQAFNKLENLWISEESKEQVLKWLKVKLLVMLKKLNSVDLSSLDNIDGPARVAVQYRNSEIRLIKECIESLNK